MTGLRDRKKKEARLRIVAAAAQLFDQDGIDATTMEDVAAAAEVSVATVYNYFGTKGALLLSVVQGDTAKMIELGKAVLADPGPDVADATKRLVGVYVDDFLTWDPGFMREILGAAYAPRTGSDITLGLASMDEQLIAQMVTLLHHFNEEGQLRPGTEPFEAAMLVFGTFVIHIFMFISLDGVDPQETKAQIERQVDLAFLGLGSTPSKKAK